MRGGGKGRKGEEEREGEGRRKGKGRGERKRGIVKLEKNALKKITGHDPN